jgi:hypothetical protein
LKTNQKFKIEWRAGSWIILDPFNPGTAGIKIDGAVVNATARGDNFVEGHIVAVHGIDMEIAQHLGRHELASLGIGAHLRAHAVPAAQRSLGKLHLMPGGRVTGAQR